MTTRILIAEDHPASLELMRYLLTASGYEVLRQVRQDLGLRHIPVIAVTAFSMVGDRERVLAAGFDDYQSKPIEPENIISQMEQHLAVSLRVRR